MEDLTRRKVKIILTYTGVTVGVCLIIRYLLPLAAPFVIALILAAVIDRPVCFLTRKCHIKRIISVIIMLVLVLGVLGGTVFLAGKKIIEQLQKFIVNYDVYMEELRTMVTGCCDGVDRCLGLSSGASIEYITGQAAKAVHALSDSVLTRIMNSSWSLINAITIVIMVVTFTIMATVFLSRDMEKMRGLGRASVFRSELAFVTGRLKNILGTYVRTQLIIMLLTSVICTVGLYFMGNDYAFLLGVVIGIIDAFPVLGTGTVFIPWMIVLIVIGRYQSGLIIFLIYMICYYSREFLEPRLMGSRLGMPPVIMLISLYVGLVLFGITGVITGPIAAMMIKEIAAEVLKK